MADPLDYYLRNTAKTRAFLQSVHGAGPAHRLLLNCRRLRQHFGRPISETAQTVPLSPYGWSKLRSAQMLADAGSAYALRYLLQCRRRRSRRTARPVDARAH
jgi:UDP-glucose 4-epimerase